MAKESSASFKELMVVSKSPSRTAQGIPISDARSRTTLLLKLPL